MSRLPLLCVLIIIVSCADKDPFSKLGGFWVSHDYKSGQPFQTLTISRPDANMYGAIPFLVETNQYGAYSFIEPLDTIHGHFEAYGPHWETAFILKLEGDTLVQTFSVGEADERKLRYVRVDSLKMWSEAIFSDLLLQINLPHPNESDNLVPERKYFVVDLFIGPLKESIRDEYPAIAPDSIVLQVNDVLLPHDLLDRFLHAEQSKLEKIDHDSIIVVLNADSKIPERQIDGWVRRINSFNPNLRVWRRYIDLDSRKLLYRDIEG